jgi:dihydroneopterin aldolase
VSARDREGARAEEEAPAAEAPAPASAKSQDNGRSDVIELRGLRVMVVIGVLPQEQTASQPIEVDLDLEVDLTRAGESDDLADTVDYGAVSAAVERVATAEPLALLERLATQIARAVLDEDERVRAVTVTTRKLRPPVPQQLETSGVRITRSR